MRDHVNVGPAIQTQDDGLGMKNLGGSQDSCGWLAKFRHTFGFNTGHSSVPTCGFKAEHRQMTSASAGLGRIESSLLSITRLL
jgi:hypothetical protein